MKHIFSMTYYLEEWFFMNNFAAEKRNNMFGTIIALAVFFAAALVGWAIAEMKGKACEYVQNEEEKAVDARIAQQLHEDGFHELTIKDVMKSISTKGFDAV